MTKCKHTPQASRTGVPKRLIVSEIAESQRSVYRYWKNDCSDDGGGEKQ